MPAPVRNDPAYYDRVAAGWWDPAGPLAMLAWLSDARARLLPPAPPPGPGGAPTALLVDLGCGAGLFAPTARRLGYRYLGLDQSAGALTVAAAHGSTPVVRAAVARLPLADGVADVVLAGEVLEHVSAPTAVLAEACRVLREGGTLLLDTVADTRLARFAAVTLGERLPGGPPRGIHDPELFIDRRAMVAAAAGHGVRLRLLGLRPSLLGYLGWLAGRRPAVPLVPTGSTAALFQGVGIKQSSVSASTVAGGRH